MAKKNNYDELEGQIGDMGAEETPTNFGKLQHSEIYTGREELTEDEKDDMKAFIARSRKTSRKVAEEDSPMVAEGWIPINRAEMGIRSQFYPETWEFMIRPATVAAIKNWTSIDEERPEQVNKVFNDIIRACVKIDTHDVQGAGWAQINSWDRFWFVLKVREYTFSEGEAKIEFEDECDECGDQIKYTLNAESLFYEFPDEDLVEKFWMGDKWVIDPTDYGVEGEEPITLYTPKLGKDEAIINWATAKIQNKQKVDENFVKFLVWMLNKPSRDMAILDKQISTLQRKFSGWDVDMYEFMTDVINNITINPSEKLHTKCPSCGVEATSTVQFPNGIKVLFKTKSNVKKFGSR